MLIARDAPSAAWGGRWRRKLDGWSAKAQSGDFRQEIKKGMQEQTPHAFRTY